MDFSLTEEQTAVRETFRSFSEKEVKPVAAELDREPRYPMELFLMAGKLGLFGMRYPQPEGAEMGMLSFILALEELAAASLSVAASCTMQSLMGTYFVHRFTRDELREQLFLPALEGKVIGTICMTEPDAGSDLLGLTTRAEMQGGRWFITGQKTWITSAQEADMFTVLARTGEKELSFFLVEKGVAGLEVGKSIDKSGVRASPTSEVSFSEAPATCMLGEQGSGLASLREILAEIRVVTAALALGVARAALEDSILYSQQRVQFGKPICKFQAVQSHLAEM
ncbi:MAG: acyl-CoA dehydrogenase family protein, partial [Planctomycetota bacterium]